MKKTFTVIGKVWKYSGKAAWYFFTIDKKVSAEIKKFSGKRIGWGSVRVTVKIGETTWKTSVFPSKTGVYELPIKAAIRKKEMIEEIKTELLSDSSDISVNNDELLELMKRYSADTPDNLLRYARQDDQDLLDAKTFISDDDASHLPAYIAQKCVALKMNMISARSDFVSLPLALIAGPKTFDLKDHVEKIGDIVWQVFLISRDIEVLSRWTATISRQSVIVRTLQNL